MLDRSSSVALYLQLAEDLASQFGTRYRPGDKLPVEPHLMDTYGVSRVTVRQAMDYLVQQGLVVRKQGKGTFVIAPVIRQDLSKMSGFYDSLVAQGIPFQTQVLSLDRVRPPAHVHRRLSLETPECMHYRRQYSLNGMPFALGDCYLTMEVADSLTLAVAQRTPSYRYLEQVGHPVARADLSIRAATVPREIAPFLGVGIRRPILGLERVSFTKDGRPVEYTMLYLRSDAYELQFVVNGAVSLVSAIKASN